MSGVTTEDLPSISFSSISGQVQPTHRYFVERFPIGIEANTIQFSYFDEGSFTTKAFAAHLGRYQRLLSKLPAFELLYVALNASMFAAADKEFHRVFPTIGSSTPNKLLPHGVEHLTKFFLAQRLWEVNSAEFTHEDLLLLREGERIYASAEHEQLRILWARMDSSFERNLKEMGINATTKGTFKACLLDQNYPVFSSKNSGSWEQNSASVHGSTVGSI